MTQVENLNKDNYFNKRMEQFPKAMASFCKFIDDYKESVGWQHLFADRKEFLEKDLTGGVIKFHPTKFHDIPVELQYGVIMKWLHTHLTGNIIEIEFPEDALARESFVQKLDVFLADVEGILKTERNEESN